LQLHNSQITWIEAKLSVKQDMQFINQVINRSSDQEANYLLNDCASMDGGIWMGVGVVPCHPS